MPFTVVVVLHDSAAELAALLRSIDAQLAARPQLIAVDTGRATAAPALAAAGAPRCSSGATTRASARPATRASSARATTSRVLLNPDCVLLDGSLAALAALAARASARAARRRGC